MPALYRGKSDTHYIFSSTFFDIDDNGNFYVVYMADSLIYKYDENYGPLYSFGFEGRSMDKEYLSVKRVGDIRGKGIAQYKTKGYYTWVEYIDELGCLLRSYSKGERELSDGLQIYKDRTLVADLESEQTAAMSFLPLLFSKQIIKPDFTLYIPAIHIFLHAVSGD